MLEFLFGYLIGSPSITIRTNEKEKPLLTKAQKRAIAKKIKHDKTCPNIDRNPKSCKEEMENIF